MLHHFKHLKATALSLLALIVLSSGPTYATMDELYGTAEKRLSTIKSKLANVGPASQEIEYDKWEIAAAPYILKEHVPKTENNLNFTDRYNLMKTVVFPAGNLNDNLKALLYKGFEAEIAPGLKKRNTFGKKDPQAQPKLTLHKEHEPEARMSRIKIPEPRDWKVYRARDENGDEIPCALDSMDLIYKHIETILLYKTGGFIKANLGTKESLLHLKYHYYSRGSLDGSGYSFKGVYDDHGVQLQLSKDRFILGHDKNEVKFNLNGGKG